MLEAPALLLGLEWFYNVFLELSTDRAIGMTMGPIPAASIDRVIQAEQLNEDEAEYFRACMRGMDNAFLKYEAEKADKARETTPTGKKTPPTK